MKKIVCHGDSLTEASDLDKKYTWPIMLESRLDLKIINSGIGGDTSGGLLGRFYDDVVRHQPDLVIILGGTNDLWWDLEVNLIQANIFTMASVTPADGKHPGPGNDGTDCGVAKMRPKNSRPGGGIDGIGQGKRHCLP